MITRKAGAARSLQVAPWWSNPPWKRLCAGTMQLAERAGIPAGVLSVVTGNSRAIGGEMTSSPIVRKLSFTGSTEIGSLLMQQCAGTIEGFIGLGGNAPFIVFDDADLDAAVEGTGIKIPQQRPDLRFVNRFLVQDGVYRRFRKLADAVQAQLKVGNKPGKEGLCKGPLINEAAVTKGRSTYRRRLSKGASHGGRFRHTLGRTFSTDG